MPTEVVLPRLGLTQEEGTVVRWIKPEGSTVKKGEPLFEVMTDKATVEVEAPASGVLLRILVAEGGTVSVATPIALIGEAGEALPVIPPPGPAPAATSGATTSGGPSRAETGAPPPAPPREAATGGAAPTGGPSGGQIKISPRARALADTHGVDVRTLAGSGPGGRIVEHDVQTAIASRSGPARAVPPAPPPAAPAPSVVSAPTGAMPAAAPAPPAAPAPVRPDVAPAPMAAPAPAMPDVAPAPMVTPAPVMPDVAPAPPVAPAPAMPDLAPAPPIEPVTPAEAEAPREVEPAAPAPSPVATRMRAIIAARMMESLHTTAQLTLTTEVDMEEAVRLRHELEQQVNVRVTYTDLIVRATAAALREHPAMNARWEGEGVRRLSEIHIGVAVALDEGLVVPVVRDAAQVTLAEISTTIRDLFERARAMRLGPEEMQGSTFTVTNLGMFDVDVFTPVLNPPEAAILGVGRVRRRPVAEGDRVEVRSTVTLSLTFDHRVVDGAPAAQFLQRVKYVLEHPQLLLMP